MYILYILQRVTARTHSHRRGHHAGSLHAFHHVHHALLCGHLVIYGLSEGLSESVHQVDPQSEDGNVDILLGLGALQGLLDLLDSWDLL